MTQGLLEAAMPPAIARALLDNVPPEAFARSFNSATIAFVALEDYASMVRNARRIQKVPTVYSSCYLSLLTGDWKP